MTPTYDANGNLTRDETGRQFVYDAWNRLVEVKDAGGATLKSYAYDGRHRRVRETAGGTTTDLYYSDAWQVLEERVGGQTRVQYVWSPVYVDALVLRDRDTNGVPSDGPRMDGLEERLYAQQDANWNVTALVDGNGNVVERYVEDPYGQVTVLTAAWADRGVSLFAWVYLHQGGRFEQISATYHFRYRDLSAALGRWLQRDPIEYEAGDSDLYRLVGNNPISALGPFGLESDLIKELWSHVNGALDVYFGELDQSREQRAVEFSKKVLKAEIVDFTRQLGWRLITASLDSAINVGVLGETFKKAYDTINKIKDAGEKIQKVAEALSKENVETLSRRYEEKNEGCTCYVNVVLLWNKGNGNFVAVFEGQVGSKVENFKVTCKPPLEPFFFTISGKAKLVKKGIWLFRYTGIDPDIGKPRFGAIPKPRR